VSSQYGREGGGGGAGRGRTTSGPSWTPRALTMCRHLPRRTRGGGHNHRVSAMLGGGQPPQTNAIV